MTFAFFFFFFFFFFVVQDSAVVTILEIIKSCSIIEIKYCAGGKKVKKVSNLADTKNTLILAGC